MSKQCGKQSFPSRLAAVCACGRCPESEVILAVDCSFIPKSGKRTYGIDYFYNGSASKAEKGLEVSAMARKLRFPVVEDDDLRGCAA